MSAAPISNELALRIGLAARELPDTDPKRLLGVLAECVGLPLSEAKLDNIKFKDLKTAADGEFSGVSTDELKAAIKHLQGKSSETAPNMPETQAYQEGDMPSSIRVAFASNTPGKLDGHFGSCARFMVYQINSEEFRLIDIRSTAGDSDAEDKNQFRSDLIKDSQVLYVMSVGGPAAAKVVKNSIHPIKVPQGGEIDATLEQLQSVLAGSPPPWLAKVMGVDAEKRTKFAGSEEEDEA